MGYTDKTIAEVADRYSELKECLRELNDAKNSSDGAVLSWVSRHYERANEALNFLKKMPAELQARLKISDLEIGLSFFANTHIRL
jgi:hypothetical protein